MIGIHTLLTMEYILYWSSCIVYMFLGTDNKLICLFWEISVTMTTCAPIHWGDQCLPSLVFVMTSWTGIQWSFWVGVRSGLWMLVGVHLIMTSPDEGWIQCLDQSSFNMVSWTVPAKPTYSLWCHRAWTIHNHLHLYTHPHCAAFVYWLVYFG